MNFHIYENGNPTKGVYNTFEEAKNVAKLFIENRSEIEIRTVNSSTPVVLWKYDYQIQQWVEQQ